MAAFPSRTNLKNRNIPLTPKFVKKVLTNLDSSKACVPDFIDVMSLRKCESEVSYILSKLFNMCLEESCFSDCWKVSSVVPVFKNVGEGSIAKKCSPVNLLSAVSSKIFKKLLNRRLVDKYGLFSDFSAWVQISMNYRSSDGCI